jgi:hypothetical protein
VALCGGRAAALVRRLVEKNLPQNSEQFQNAEELKLQFQISEIRRVNPLLFHTFAKTDLDLGIELEIDS